MKGLYKQLCDKTKDVKGLVPVEQLVSKAGITTEVTNKLISLGFNVQNLGQRGQAILFTALNDIVAVYKGDSFYFATFSVDKLKELLQYNMLLPNEGCKDFSGVDRLVRANTVETINTYLAQGKYHFIKLNMYDKCKTSCSLFTVTGMNPYPDLIAETVYSLTNMANWHNTLYNALVGGCYKLTMIDGVEYCQNYLSSTMSLAPSGVLLTKDFNNNLVELPLHKIKDYEPYNPDSFVMKLYKGVVSYDGTMITLNRQLLEKYYGEKLVNAKLESKTVRYRYCLEELLTRGYKFSVAYYINKYQIEIYDADDVYDLADKLKSLIKREDDKGIINARVLTSASQILAGHKSYYMRINLDKIGNHDIKVVEDLSSVLPKEYDYYAISHSLGYNKVTVSATSDSLALKYGETEFERQFGKNSRFSGVVANGVLIKGTRPYKMSIEIQRRLCQNIMYGYKANYEGYKKILLQILAENEINTYSDEAIKLIYINGLARKYKRGQEVMLIDVVDDLIKFMELLSDTTALNKKLMELETNIAYRNCQKEYQGIVDALPDLKGFKVDDTPEGRYIITLWGRYNVTKSGIGKTVELYYNDKKLGNKILK